MVSVADVQKLLELELGQLRVQEAVSVKVEVAVLGFPSLIVRNYGLCGRTEITRTRTPQISGAVSVTVEVAILGSPSLTVRQ